MTKPSSSTSSFLDTLNRQNIPTVLLVIIIIAATAYAGSIWYEKRLQQQANELLINDLTRSKSVAVALNVRLSALDGVVTYATIYPNKNELNKQWQAFANNYLNGVTGVDAVAIQMLDGFSISYPPEIQNDAIRTEITKSSPASLAKRMEAMRTKTTVFGEPLVKATGQLGLVVYKPFSQNNVVAGTVAAIIDLDSVLKEGGFEANSSIRQRAALRDQNGSMIYGDPAAFAAPNAAKVKIDLPTGYWELTAQPSNELASASNLQVWLIRAIGLAIALLSGLVVYQTLGRQNQLELLVDSRTQELARTNTALASDIAERKRTELSLRNSEAQNRALLAAIPDLMFRLDREDRFIGYQSRNPQDWLVPPSQFMSRTIDEVMPPEISKQYKTAAKLAIDTSETQIFEYRVGIQNEERDYEGRVVSVSSDETLVLIRDITDRKQTVQGLEQRVDERTRELSTLLRVSRQLTSTLEVRPLLDAVLAQVKEIIGYDIAMILAPQGDDFVYLDYEGPGDSEEIVGTFASEEVSFAAHEIVADRDIDVIGDLFNNEIFSKQFMASLSDEMRQTFTDIRSMLGVPIEIKDRVIGVMILGHKKAGFYSPAQAQLALGVADQAAIALENARLYEQAQGLAVVEERQRLARELHDAVSQTLFSASLISEVLPVLYERNRAEGERRLDELRWFTRGALAEMRMLLLELRPTGLTDSPLSELLRQLGEAATARTRFPINLQVQGSAILPPDVQLSFYRIAQEALNNIWKHAEATQVDIRLWVIAAQSDVARTGANQSGAPLTTGLEPKAVAASARLEIVDNGRGFDRTKVPANHYGLLIMEERAQSVGATLTIQSRNAAFPDGTSIVVEWNKDGSAPAQNSLPTALPSTAA